MNSDKIKEIVKENLVVKNGVYILGKNIKPNNGEKKSLPPAISYEKIFKKLFPDEEKLSEPTDYDTCQSCGGKLAVSKDNRYACLNCSIESPTAHFYDSLISNTPTKTDIEIKELNLRSPEEEA